MISRSERDLVQVKKAFYKKYKKTLNSFIKASHFQRLHMQVKARLHSLHVEHSELESGHIRLGIDSPKHYKLPLKVN